MTSLVIFLPLAGGLAAALTPGIRRAPRRAGGVSLAFALATLAIAVYMVAAFDGGATGPQWVQDETWISGLGIHYRVGVDGLSLFLVLLAAALWPVATLASMWTRWPGAHPPAPAGSLPRLGGPASGPERPGLYFGMLALGETAVLGAFTAQDLALFVVFFDLMLVPFYFLIGVFGGERRLEATTKFVIYTLVGSLLMLVAAVATGVLSAGESGRLSFALADLRQTPLPEGSQQWIFLLFAAAFLVKMPAFPIHGWMPDAYLAAPLPVVALLSAVLSKVGAYGFLRIVLPLYPDAAARFQELLLVIAVASILYGSVMAFTRDEARLVVGYSSVAQLGFVTAGIFALRPEGAQGAVLQMVNHGVVVAALFLIVAMLAARTGTESLDRMGGAAFRGPVLAALFLAVAMATLAMPGTANFAGELLILVAVFKAKIVYAIIASAGVAFAAVYMLRFYQRSMHRRVGANVVSSDLSPIEAVLLAPLVAAVVALSLYPQIVLGRADRSVTASIAPADAVTGAEAR